MMRCSVRRGRAPSRRETAWGGTMAGSTLSATTTWEVPDGQGSWVEREERQAVRGPAQEGHEQVPRGRDLQLRGLVEPRWQEQRQQPEPPEQRRRKRRQPCPEGRCRTQGRQEVELTDGRAAGVAAVARRM